MAMPKLTSNHANLAKVVAQSVKSKPDRAAALIARALTLNIKTFPADNDKEMQEHVRLIGGVLKAEDTIPSFAAQIKSIKAPVVSFKAQKGRYGEVSAALVEQFCKAEKNVTEDKIGEACGNAAKKQGDSGVKLLTGHAKYSAELKITGASQRLYAVLAEKGPRYKFTVLGKHT
jgi:hypothetical protein